MKKLLSLLLLLTFALPTYAMQRPQFNIVDSTIQLSGTRYYTYDAGGALTSNASESLVTNPVGAATKISGLIFRVSITPPAATSANITLMKNGVETALKCTINPGSTSCTDVSVVDTVTFNPGDTASWESNAVGTLTTGTMMYVSTIQTGVNANEASYSGGDAAASATVEQFNPLFGSTWTTPEGPNQCVMPTAGTIDQFYVLDATGQPGTGKSYTLTMMQNGASTTLSAAISGTNTTGSDLAHSLTIAVGDRLSIASVPSGTPGSHRLAWGFRWKPTTDGEAFYCNMTTTNPTTGGNRNHSPYAGILNVTTAVGDADVPIAFTQKKMYGYVQTVPGGTATWTLTTRKNASNTAISAVIASASNSGNDTTHSVSYALNDTLGDVTQPLNSPALPAGFAMSWVSFIPPPTAAILSPSKFRIFGGKLVIKGGKIIFQ